MLLTGYINLPCVFVVKREKVVNCLFSNKISNFPLEKIHYDYSRFTWLCPLRRKSKFFYCFLKFQKLVENQFDQQVKIFQYEDGGEFNLNDFLAHIRNSKIEIHMFCLGTPKQNRVAEWKHQHIVETGLTMLFHANLPLSLWVDIFFSAM